MSRKEGPPIQRSVAFRAHRLQHDVAGPLGIAGGG